jgi:hexokinase
MILGREETDQHATGSMADVPKDLLNQIKEFEEIFTVDQKKLKEIVAHFVKELEKGTPRNWRCHCPGY